VLADGLPETQQPPVLISPAPPEEESGGTQDAPEQISGEQVQRPSRLSARPVIVEEALSETSGSQDMEGEPSGGVSFDALDSRMRENNLNILALQATIDSIEVMDYSDMKKDLRAGIAMLEQQKEQLSMLVQGTNGALEGLKTTLNNAGLEPQLAASLNMSISAVQPSIVAYPSATLLSMDTQIDSLQDTLEDLEDGVIQEDAELGVMQLENANHQIVMGGQTLYITLLGLEQTQQGLQRQLEALDRTVEELELRYSFGQISALTLAEVKAGRTSLVSGMATLEMNMTGLRRQLESMLGEEITGELTLEPLLAVTDEQLAAMDYEADLEQVKKHSFTLYNARKTLWDAEDAHTELVRADSKKGYEVDAAEYTVTSAELSLKATEQSIELSFAALFDQIADQKQVITAARTALAVKEDSLAAAQLKYTQGSISHNALLEAENAVAEAQTAVDTALVDLFTYYNNYRWAVDHGILN